MALLNLAMLILAAVTFAATVVFLVPMASREWTGARLAELRDEIEDDLLTGQLTRQRDTVRLRDVLGFFAERPQDLNYISLIVITRAAPSAKVSRETPAGRHDDVGPAEREWLRSVEDDMVRIVRRAMVFNSALWPLLGLGRLVYWFALRAGRLLKPHRGGRDAGFQYFSTAMARNMIEAKALAGPRSQLAGIG